MSRDAVPLRALRRSDLVVYAPRPSPRRRWSFASALPVEVVLVDGLAIAVYANDSVAQYRSLDELLEDHDLAPKDLVLRDFKSSV